MKNIGSKIKGFSVFLLIFGVQASIISSIILMVFTKLWIGYLTMLGGSLCALIFFFFFFGFGELIQKTNEIAANTKHTSSLLITDAMKKENSNKSKNKSAEKQIRESVIEEYKNEEYKNEEYKNEEYKNEDVAEDAFQGINAANENECPSCFHEITKGDKECPYCGYKLK